MESGFDSDPAFFIIMMPETEDKEKDGISPTETPKTDANMADSATGQPGDRECGRDSAN